MFRKALVAVIVALVAVSSIDAHDMFLRFSTYFLPANRKVSVELINGTFDKSENAIARSRMLDVSVVGPGRKAVKPDTTQWQDVDSTSVLSFETGGPGTYVAGVSTAPRMIELSAEDFNEYLSHDGVLDILKQRTDAGDLDKPATERYSKHVKAVFQVGNRRTRGFSAKLRYPIEIVPQRNPYKLEVGDELGVRVFLRGKALRNQLVYASHEGYHGHDDQGRHIEAVQTRTNWRGKATIPLSEPGRWYVRLIHMAPVDEPGVDYESNWATLTFEVQ